LVQEYVTEFEKYAGFVQELGK